MTMGQFQNGKDIYEVNVQQTMMRNETSFSLMRFSLMWFPLTRQGFLEFFKCNYFNVVPLLSSSSLEGKLVSSLEESTI